jgi:hypothetical protein
VEIEDSASAGLSLLSEDAILSTARLGLGDAGLCVEARRFQRVPWLYS